MPPKGAPLPRAKVPRVEPRRLRTWEGWQRRKRSPPESRGVVAGVGMSRAGVDVANVVNLLVSVLDDVVIVVFFSSPSLPPGGPLLAGSKVKIQQCIPGRFQTRDVMN